MTQVTQSKDALRVLLVDDEPINLEMLVEMFASSGHQVETAPNGAQALESFDTYRPDIVMTDIEMPGMSGLDLLANIRAQDTDTIVVVFTGAGNEDYAMQALRLSANDYLKKPFDVNEFRRLLDKYAAMIAEKKLNPQLLKYIVNSSLTLEMDNDISIVYEVVHLLITQCAPLFSRTEQLSVQLSLAELLFNAIEHGNLGISYVEKTEAMLKEGSVLSLVQQRLLNPVMAKRRVRIEYTLEHALARWRITDEGEGFDADSFLKSVDDTLITSTHGRGILLTKMQVDGLYFEGRGNTVVIEKGALANTHQTEVAG